MSDSFATWASWETGSTLTTSQERSSCVRRGAQSNPAMIGRGCQVTLLHDQRAVHAQQRGRRSWRRSMAEPADGRRFWNPLRPLHSGHNGNHHPREIVCRRAIRKMLDLLVLTTVARPIVVARSRPLIARAAGVTPMSRTGGLPMAQVPGVLMDWPVCNGAGRRQRPKRLRN